MYMKTKSTKSPQPLPLGIKKSKANVSMANVDAVFKDQIKVEPTSEEGSKSASVKFMITMQDEIELRYLGYSETQIYKLKPQEAANILHAGTKAEDTQNCNQNVLVKKRILTRDELINTTVELRKSK